MDRRLGPVYREQSFGASPAASVLRVEIRDTPAYLSAPTLCSLDGTNADMIVGSTDGLYRVSLPGVTFDAEDTDNWPWPTFHFNAARTGCSTAPTMALVSASIAGNVQDGGGNPIEGAAVSFKDWATNTTVPGVAGRSAETRADPIYCVGDASVPDEVNKGAFVISQLPTGDYKITVSKPGYTNSSVRVIWAVDVTAPVESSPLVYGNYVYFGATLWEGFPNFYAVDKENGELRWSRAFEHEVHASPTALRDGVYIGTDTGSLMYRLNASTGLTDPIRAGNPFEASSALTNYFLSEAPLTRSGLVFVGNENGALYSLSSLDLEFLQIRGQGGSVRSGPAVTYAAEPGARWVYVVSRANGGTLQAYRQPLLIGGH